MEIMGEENIAELTEKFDDCLKIEKLYNNIVGDLAEIPASDQYEEVKLWLKKIGDVISTHIRIFKIDQSENIKILEKSILDLKKYYDLFKGGELSTPILDIDEFHDLLNKSGFDIQTKVEIKKAIGKENYNLIYENKTKESLISKYQTIYSDKESIYYEDIILIQSFLKEKKLTLSLEESINQINIIKEELKEINHKNIIKSVETILLKRELDSFNVDNEEEVIQNIETILNQFKNMDINQSNEETMKDNTNDKINLLLKSAEEIIDNEKELLNKIKNKELDLYYNDTLTNDKDNELTLGILVSSINDNVTILKNLIENNLSEEEYKEYILNLEEYLETYNIIKKRINKDTINSKNK